MAYEYHGLKGTREYNIWLGIKQRCYNKNNSSYKYYGAKGIKMCEEWKDSALTFCKWLYSNGYDSTAPFGRYTVDRVDTFRKLYTR